MESSIAKFLWRQPACERLPTRHSEDMKFDVAQPSLPNEMKVARPWWARQLNLCNTRNHSQSQSVAGGHTASNAPDLFRPPKLSGAGPGKYWGGGPPGKTSGCCQLLQISALAKHIR